MVKGMTLQPRLRRVRVGNIVLRQGTLFAALPRLAQAESGLGTAPIPPHLPRLWTRLTPIAGRSLLTGVPSGTGTVGAAVEDVGTVSRGAILLRD